MSVTAYVVQWTEKGVRPKQWKNTTPGYAYSFPKAAEEAITYHRLHTGKKRIYQIRKADAWTGQLLISFKPEGAPPLRTPPVTGSPRGRRFRTGKDNAADADLYAAVMQRMGR